MLYLLHGKSSGRKSAIQTLAKEHSLHSQHIHDNDIKDVEIAQVVSTQTGLFGEKELYVIYDVCRILDLKALLPGFAESDNIFIFSEESVTKPIIKNFEKVEATIQD
jgi:hypothetical protein